MDDSLTTTRDVTPNESSSGVVAFVFAILGLVGVLPCIGPIVAIVAGANDRSSLGRAGVVIGWVTLAIYALIAMLFVVLGGVALVAAAASH